GWRAETKRPASSRSERGPAGGNQSAVGPVFPRSRGLSPRGELDERVGQTWHLPDRLRIGRGEGLRCKRIGRGVGEVNWRTRGAQEVEKHNRGDRGGPIQTAITAPSRFKTAAPRSRAA